MDAYQLLKSYPWDHPATVTGRLHRMRETLARLAQVPEPAEPVRKLIEEMEAPLRAFARALSREEAASPECDDHAILNALSILKPDQMLAVWPAGDTMRVGASWKTLAETVGEDAIAIHPSLLAKLTVLTCTDGLRVFVSESAIQRDLPRNHRVKRLVSPEGECDIRGPVVFAWEKSVQK